MSKGLRALERIKDHMELTAKHWKQDVGYIEEELKALDVIKQQFRLVANQLQAKDERAVGGWARVKDIENDDELNAWKEVLS